MIEDVPTVDIVDESPAGDAVKALEQSAPAGEISKGAETPSGGGEVNPVASSSSSSTPRTEAQIRAQTENFAKRGRGRPPGAKSTERARGDSTLTAKELENLRKAEITALYQQTIREKKALEEQLEDAKTSAVVNSSQHAEVIDDAIHDACGFAAESVANMAAAKWGPAARINNSQKEQLATAWSRVAKLYLGAHAQYSPVAAALLATVAVVGEKYVDVQLAGGTMPRPSLVAEG